MIDQRVPFHVSIRLWRAGPAEPNARQNVVLVQDTSVRELSPLPGLGPGLTDQRIPFHISIRTWIEGGGAVS